MSHKGSMLKTPRKEQLNQILLSPARFAELGLKPDSGLKVVISEYIPEDKIALVGSKGEVLYAKILLPCITDAHL